MYVEYVNVTCCDFIIIQHITTDIIHLNVIIIYNWTESRDQNN